MYRTKNKKGICISKGFTLLELLLSVFIFALISTGAYQVFNVAQKNAAALKESQARLHDISLSFALIEKDFTQLTPRTWRDAFSDAPTPSLQTDFSGNYLVKLIRTGWRNPLGTNRSNQQAVTYRIEDDKLIREHTQHLDNISSVEPIKTELLDKVSSVAIRYLDKRTGEWKEQWVQENTSNLADNNENTIQLSTPLPLAIEFTMELEDLGSLVSIIALSPGA